MSQLDEITTLIRQKLEEINAARDRAYQQSRELTSLCAKAIRTIHREEWRPAESLLAQAQQAAETMASGLKNYPDLYYAGYTQDALKEYVEARLVYALIRNQPLPTPKELAVEDNTWLNGLAEATTELRRRILDIIRLGHNNEAERLLDNMDEIYSLLVTFDFNDTITGGLRRRTDTVRGVLERTRGDVTTSFRQEKLERALEAVEKFIVTG